jgi:hypothetical protein
MRRIRGGGRPKAYKTADGKRVPSVSTITGRFKESGGLVHWAWQLGIDGIDYRAARDKAADVGHLVHERIDAYIHGEPEPPTPTDVTPAMLELVDGGFTTFLEWATQFGLTVLETEVPLVSERYKFGGTFDAVAVALGRTVLLDWKSGGGIYPETVCQVAAYRELLRERGTAIDEAYVLRVGKEMGDFHFHAYSERVVDLGWEAFQHMRELYTQLSKLKTVAA